MDPDLLTLIIWLLGIGDDLMEASATISAAFIGGVFTVVAAGIAAAVVMIQVRHQATEARDQLARAEALRLKLKIYEDVTSTVSEITARCIAFGSVCRNIGYEVRSVVTTPDTSIPPTYRYPAVSAAYMETANAAIDIITTVERWIIIEPGIDVFQAAANVAITDLRVAFSERLVPMLFTALPIDYEGGTLPWTPPTLEFVDALDEAIADVQDALSAIQMYGQDFQREMQNVLVGDLGKSNVPARRPLDPSTIVPTLDNREAALAYFYSDQTQFGCLCMEADARARAVIAARDA